MSGLTFGSMVSDYNTGSSHKFIIVKRELTRVIPRAGDATGSTPHNASALSPILLLQPTNVSILPPTDSVKVLWCLRNKILPIALDVLGEVIPHFSI